MTDKDAERRLERLYREGRNIEPPAGLDRIIRARADLSLRKTPARRFPWLGGLVTASVAVMAIALVLQQSPPGPPGPPAVPEAMDSRALLPESPVAGARPAESREADHVRDADPSPAAVSAPAGQALETPERLRRSSEPERSESRTRRELQGTDSNDASTDRLMVTGSRARMSDFGARPTEEISDEALVARLRALIEAGQIEQARDLLDGMTATGREPDLPDDLERALHPPDDH